MASKRYLPICWWCKHFTPEKQVKRDPYSCTVFPEGIPGEIFNSLFDHRQNHPDDDGTTFEKIDDFQLATKRSPFEDWPSMEFIDAVLQEQFDFLDKLHDIPKSEESED